MIISRLFSATIIVADNIREADLVIIQPFAARERQFVVRLAMRRLQKRVRLGGCKSYVDDLKYAFGVCDRPALFVSHENLDSQYWWGKIGRFLVNSDLPRLTFWPQCVDPSGMRFPYWYNYVQWDSYARSATYDRFGAYYSMSSLLSPLVRDERRLEKAVLIASHLNHPRKGLAGAVSQYVGVEYYGAAHGRPIDKKLPVMQQYKYAFCPENSAGIGYETEKLPEAWVAGCIPIGCFSNPMGDFNKHVVERPFGVDDVCFQEPLLWHRPSLVGLEQYLSFMLRDLKT